MKIIKTDPPLWTWQHLEHYKKYSNVYGLELSTSQMEQEINLLEQGLPGRRHGPETECYDIYTEAGELVGEITLSQVNHVPEISIVIFKQYSGQGLAKRALAELVCLSKNNFKTIEAVVKSTNPFRNAVRHILESAGFVFKFKLPGGGLLFVLDFHAAEAAPAEDENIREGDGCLPAR